VRRRRRAPPDPAPRSRRKRLAYCAPHGARGRAQKAGGGEGARPRPAPSAAFPPLHLAAPTPKCQRPSWRARESGASTRRGRGGQRDWPGRRACCRRALGRGRLPSRIGHRGAVAGPRGGRGCCEGRRGVGRGGRTDGANVSHCTRRPPRARLQQGTARWRRRTGGTHAITTACVPAPRSRGYTPPPQPPPRSPPPPPPSAAAARVT
jgi:hypothetical protein